MKPYELFKARVAISAKLEALQEGLQAAQERARTYYNERLQPAENDPLVTDEEMDAIYDTYDELCDMVTELETKVEIAEKAVAALDAAETALRLVEIEGIWEGE